MSDIPFEQCKTCGFKILTTIDQCPSCLQMKSGVEGIKHAGIKHEGTKHDKNKITWRNIPWSCLKEVVEVSSYGAKKYGINNWQNLPDREQRYMDACLRHITAWKMGETRDPETGKHHLAHAICCLLFVMWK